MRRAAIVVAATLGFTIGGSGSAMAASPFAGAHATMHCHVLKYVDGHHRLKCWLLA